VPGRAEAGSDVCGSPRRQARTGAIEAELRPLHTSLSPILLLLLLLIIILLRLLPPPSCQPPLCFHNLRRTHKHKHTHTHTQHTHTHTCVCVSCEMSAGNPKPDIPGRRAPRTTCAPGRQFQYLNHCSGSRPRLRMMCCLSRLCWRRRLPARMPRLRSVKSYALHHTPYTLHPTLYTLHLMPYTLHPMTYAPGNFSPKPWTLNPKP
jgi:hypothetical protein